MLILERESSFETGKVRLGSGIFTPRNIIFNEDLVEYFAHLGIRTDHGNSITCESIENTTGIRSRHWLSRIEGMPEERAEAVPGMAIAAAVDALSELKWNEVDYVLASTTFPYRESLSEQLASSLREGYAVAAGEVVGDTYAACAGSAWVLNYLRENSQRFWGKRILFAASEYISSTIEGINSTLFSDGAGAMAFVYGEDLEILASSAVKVEGTERFIRFPVIAENLPDRGVIAFVPTALPDESQPFNAEEGLNMRYGQLEGKKVFEFAVSKVPEIIQETLEDFGLEVDEIDLVIPHQANGRISKALSLRLKKIGIEAEVFSNIEDHGNTSSASIPIAIHQAKEQGKIVAGSKVAIVGFGAGMAVAACVVEFKK